MKDLLIKTIPFTKEEIDKIRTHYIEFNDYPIIYILHKQTEAYIGESVNAFNRLHSHRLNRHNKINSKNRHDFEKITLIKHEKFNQSATFNLETKLINYFLGEEKYKLRNVSQTTSSVVHNYYEKEFYNTDVFIGIWDALKNIENIVEKDLFLIENSDVFKLSPFKQLKDEQFDLYQKVTQELEQHFHNIKHNNLEEKKVILIKGSAGVGKSVVLSSLYYKTLEMSKDKNSNLYKTTSYILINHKEALKTFHNIASNVSLMEKNKILRPTSFINNKKIDCADVVFIDEAHLLLSSSDKYTKYYGNNHLEDIIKKSKVTIVIFDPKQVTKYKAYWNLQDIESILSNYKLSRHKLSNQLRMEAGDQLIDWIDKFTKKKLLAKPSIRPSYEFKIFRDASKMHELIKQKNKEYRLSRLVSTFDFVYKENECIQNIKTGGIDLSWNITDSSTTWAQREDDDPTYGSSINEVGSIYTVQGFDLNYVGVILGPSISYDKKDKLLIICENYKDTEAFKGLSSNPRATKIKEEIILNSLNILMKRGIKGLYLYAHDEKLRNKLLEIFGEE